MRLILFGFKGDVMHAVSSGAWECVTWVMLGQKSLEKPMTTHLENLEIKQGALQCCHSSRMAFQLLGDKESGARHPPGSLCRKAQQFFRSSVRINF